MSSLVLSLAEFLITPAFRWILLLISTIISIVLYVNEPLRFSFVKSFLGISYKLELYIIAIISLIAIFLTFLGMWITIPFTTILPDYWYLPVFIILIAIITQITISSPQISDDGSFNPPPIYILPLKYRIILSYTAFIIDTIIFIQAFIYFGIADYTKKTVISRYILERFGGWYDGNKLDFIFEWLGIFDLIIRSYVLQLQFYFTACKYSLPQSWNF